jgi:hypothetical protein
MELCHLVSLSSFLPRPDESQGRDHVTDASFRFCFAACAVSIPITGMLAGDKPLFWRLGIWRNTEPKSEADVLDDQ